MKQINAYKNSVAPEKWEIKFYQSTYKHETQSTNLINFH